MISINPGDLARKVLKQDKGSIILEGVVSIGIISLLTLGYASTAAQATVTQRTAVNESIATQVAQGALEKAKATNWSDVGTNGPSTVALPSGAEPIVDGTLVSAAAPTPIRSLPVTVRTSVGWQQKPAGPSEYGVKVVVVEVSWEDTAGDAATAHKKSEKILVTPGIGEAVPSGVRGASEIAPAQPAPGAEGVVAP